MTTETFWIYRNRNTRRSRIHRGSCFHCNEGKGGTWLDPSSLWHGPFESYEAAVAFACKASAGVRPCRMCKP